MKLTEVPLGGSDLFIVDNSDNDWKVLRYLQDFCEISEKIDIATGYFEIGSLLALKNKWNGVDKIRILMGDEVSKRTARVIRESFEGIQEKLDKSLDEEKIKNDFLDGVSTIVEALINGKIECRVFKKDKFHAKAYITHSRLEVVGSTALVGSSNFTKPGLADNVELNVQVRGAEVGLLQKWYEQHWEQAEECTPEILKIIERHAKEYSPFDVWLKAISDYLRGHEATVDEWERNESKIFPMLAKYQQDGYHAMLKRGEKYGGAFLCDGVGLGKTFVGLMLIERFLMFKGSRKSVALFVPKAAREAVWERELEKHLPKTLGGFLPFKIFNHTDLHRDKLENELDNVRTEADVIIIDEAHHFRNRGRRGETDFEKRSRYFRMLELTEGKQVFLLTATPINNKLLDFKHLIDLFAREDPAYFAANLGIHSLDGHFRSMEKELDEKTAALEGANSTEGELNMSIVGDIMDHNILFKELVVQRSRRYVKESLGQASSDELLFPIRQRPQVADYDVKKTYGNLLNKIEEGFSKTSPLFMLSVYNPYMRYIGPEDQKDTALENRHVQIVRLIRLGFLKRFESSAQAFEMSCRTLMFKLLAWVSIHITEDQKELDRLERWKRRHGDLIDYIFEVQRDLFDDQSLDEPEEDVIPQEFLDHALEKQLNADEFDVPAIIDDAYEDLDNLVEFLRETQKVTPTKDDKLQRLAKLLKSDDVLKKHKVIVFTEFKSTARYLAKQLNEMGFKGVDVIDSSTSENRAHMIQRFAPYYNGSSSPELTSAGKKEIQILISTDVLAEGLNLQDCTRLINYDIHWNPVRLMQRIGRIDRRMNPKIENKILEHHPDTAKIRGTAAYWNFLPPGELDTLLKLHKKVANKTLRISKVLGLEGGKLLKPDDDFDDLKDFDEMYEGKTSFDESLHLEYQKLILDNPELEQQIAAYPSKMFSGKACPEMGTVGAFFCYALPAPRTLSDGEIIDTEAERWSTANGNVEWYFIDDESEEISQEPRRIARLIRSSQETPRENKMSKARLVELRKKIEKQIKNDYLRRMNAPAGVKPELRSWMEIN
jgi:superfamily II DNA/RNA helicase